MEHQGILALAWGVETRGLAALKKTNSIRAGVGILPQWTPKESQAKNWFFDYDPKFESHPEEGKSGKSFAAFQEAQNYGFLPR
jgi:hypothetical protein